MLAKGLILLFTILMHIYYLIDCSAITNRFVMGKWIAKYDPTVEESYQTTIGLFSIEKFKYF